MRGWRRRRGPSLARTLTFQPSRVSRFRTGSIISTGTSHDKMKSSFTACRPISRLPVFACSTYGMSARWGIGLEPPIGRRDLRFEIATFALGGDRLGEVSWSGRATDPTREHVRSSALRTRRLDVCRRNSPIRRVLRCTGPSAHDVASTERRGESAIRTLATGYTPIRSAVQRRHRVRQSIPSPASPPRRADPKCSLPAPAWQPTFNGVASSRDPPTGGVQSGRRLLSMLKRLSVSLALGALIVAGLTVSPASAATTTGTWHQYPTGTSEYQAEVQQPINSANTSNWSAKSRGGIPIMYKLSSRTGPAEFQSIGSRTTGTRRTTLPTWHWLPSPAHHVRGHRNAVHEVLVPAGRLPRRLTSLGDRYRHAERPEAP